MRDAYSDFLPQGKAEATGNQCIKSQTISATTNGTAADLRGFDGALIVINIGDSAGTPTTTNKWTLSVEESDAAGSGFAAVDDSELLGGSVNGAIHVIDDATTKDNITITAAYIGKKRYLRVVATKAASAPDQPISADIIACYPAHSPAK